MGKTLLSLFSQFKKNELCQLYIYPSVPDKDVCNSYYRITDKEILHGFYKLSKVGGKLDGSKINKQIRNRFANDKDAVLYKKHNSQSSLNRLLRDIMWKVARWNNNKLKEWLKEENPTHIFLAPGYAKFIYDIALKISDELKIPIITYICDDYYFVKQPKSVLGKFQLKQLQRKIEKTMKHTSHLIAISEEIKMSYSNEFSVPATVIMTGSNYMLQYSVLCKESIDSISYFGNLSCNRYKSLSEIGMTLDRINGVMKKNFRLKIYTGEKNQDILSVFNSIKSVQLCGFITGDEFEKALLNSNLLLHTESFDEESIDLVKYSVSTKIADSLSSGVPLFAYGSDKIASMLHLIRNDCAFIVNDISHLEETLIIALTDFKERERITRNGLRTAAQYHLASVNSALLKNVFEKVE